MAKVSGEVPESIQVLPGPCLELPEFPQVLKFHVGVLGVGLEGGALAGVGLEGVRVDGDLIERDGVQGVPQIPTRLAS